MAPTTVADAGRTLSDLAFRSPRTSTVAVVGLGSAGLPTCLALAAAGSAVLGLDASPARVREIEQGQVDLLPRDRDRLGAALRTQRLRLSSDPSRIAEADAVIVAVPTPEDEQLRPDPRDVHGACAGVTAYARAGQTIILSSSTYVGTTRRCLIDPLARRGLIAGQSIHVAFAPERILPGGAVADQVATPRVLGGATAACTRAAQRVLAPVVDHVHALSSPEAAELTRLLESTYRAINLAFAIEFAAMAAHFGVDPAVTGS